MEKKLLEIFNIVNTLAEKQDNVFAEINYKASSQKILEISIRSQKDFSFIETCKIQLKDNSIIKLDDFTELLKKYVGGFINE